MQPDPKHPPRLTTPKIHDVRSFLTGRATVRAPLPDIAEIRRQLGWHFIPDPQR